MSARKKDSPPTELDMLFGEALARFIQTDPRELTKEIEKANKEAEETERYAAERRDSIRRGARRAPKRFRL
jgi:hypothetical protein